MVKLRKDGIPKHSGLREGDRRVGRALSLKLQVVDEYRLRQRQKAGGHCCAPLQETATQFNVHKSLVSKWAAQEDELRRVLTQTSAVRFSLHPGSKCRFPLAEADTYTACKEHTLAPTVSASQRASCGSLCGDPYWSTMARWRPLHFERATDGFKRSHADIV